MEVYKVLHRTPRGLVSAGISNTDGTVSASELDKWVVHYDPTADEITGYKDTGLFVFRTLEDAQKWVEEDWTSMEIWVCEAEVVLRHVVEHVAWLYPEHFGNFWWLWNTRVTGGLPAPIGTMIVKSLRMLERVE